MEIRYQLELSDYVDACSAYQFGQKQQGKTVRTRPIAWLALAFFAILFLVATARAAWHLKMFNAKLASELADKIQVSAPWLFLCFFPVLSLAAGKSRGLGKSVFLIIGAAGFATAIFIARFRSPGNGEWMIGWFVVSWYWARYWKSFVGNTEHRKAWKRQPHLHRPQKLHWDVQGVELADSLSKSFYAWPAITKWSESSTLFLLYVSDQAFHFVPKSAFPDETLIGDFRQNLIQTTEKGRGSSPAIPAVPAS